MPQIIDSVRFFSHTPSDTPGGSSSTERNANLPSKESLIIVFGILRGKECLLKTGHLKLFYLVTFNGKNNPLLRWLLSFQPYKFHIVHIAGKDNLGGGSPQPGLVTFTSRFYLSVIFLVHFWGKNIYLLISLDSCLGGRVKATTFYTS